MNAQLLDLSARYTDRYPDVLVLKDKIAKTEKLRDESHCRREAQTGNEGSCRGL